MTTKNKTNKTAVTTTTEKGVPILSPIAKRICELLEKGYDKKKVVAYLTIEDFSNKEIEKAVKDAGLVTARSSGFTYPDTLAYLSEAPRTEKEFYEKILAEGTKNEARWINDRNKIRVTYNSIFLKYKEEFTEVLASTELKKEVKEKAAAK